MYDYGITYYCLFPGGGGPTSLKSVADKIYALGKKMHDETGDNQDGADDDESPKKAAGLSIDQGDQQGSIDKADWHSHRGPSS